MNSTSQTSSSEARGELRAPRSRLYAEAMSTLVSSLRNLGPATEAACARAGIHSAEDLCDLGPDAAYARLLDAGTRPHFIGYYALVMALQGRPWNDCQGAEKQALRRRFDAIVSAQALPERSALEAALDALGVIDPARAKRP